MGNLKSHISDDEKEEGEVDDKKEEGELSSDDNDSDIQGNHISERSHSDHTAGVYIHTTVTVTCDTGTQSTASDEKKNDRSGETSTKGLKRHGFALCEYQSLPVSKYSKTDSPGLNKRNVDDDINHASSSSNDRIAFHSSKVVTREVWERNNYHSLEKATRRNIVHDDVITISSNKSNAAKKASGYRSNSPRDYGVREHQKETLHKRHHVTSSRMMYNDYLTQVPGSRYTPSLRNERTPTSSMYHINGHRTSQPCSRDRHIPPPTTAPQRARDAKLSDIIGQKLHSIRHDKRGHFHSQNGSPQTELHERYQRASFSESTESTCIRYAPKRTQFSDGRMAHNTRDTHSGFKTTTHNPVSAETSKRFWNDSMMQENLTKPKADKNLQEKKQLKKYLSALAEHNQRVKKYIKNKLNGSSNLCEPTTAIYTPYKIVKIPTVESQSVLRSSSWVAVPNNSAQEVTSCNGTLEQTEQINQLDSGLPQIDDETTADVNLASSLSESQSKFTEPQEEPKPNETNRPHVYSSPLNMFETYRDKQASIKGITATHDEAHVMRPAQTQEEEACNKHASDKEITETHDEGYVMSSAQPREREACNNHVSAMEITETHKGRVMSSAAGGNKHDSAKEITETHYENNVISPAEAQETCSKQASAMEHPENHEISFAAVLYEACTTQAKEVTESHYEGNVMSSAADGSKQASAKEKTETHDEGCVRSSSADLHEACTTQPKENIETHNENVMRPADTHEEETCNKQALESTETHADETYNKQASESTESYDEEACNILALESTGTHDNESCNKQALESTEIHDNGPVVSSAAETQEVCNIQDSAIDITETHENHAMSSTEAQKEAACNNQVSALVINETYDADCVMSSAVDTQEDGDKQDSAKEINETLDGGHVMSPAETQEACNKHVSTMEIPETQDNVICSAADGNKQDDAKEVSETHNERHVINLAEKQEEEDCNKQVSALVINETHDEVHVMSSAADAQEGGHKEYSVMEITDTHVGGYVMSPAETQRGGACKRQDSAMEHTEKHEISFAADGNKQAYAKENTEIHDEGCVMSSAADLHEACTTQPKENIETRNEHVMSPADTHDEETCNKQAVESTGIHHKGPVVSSAAETQKVCNRQDSAMEITETYDESYAMGPTEAHKEAACNKQVSALVINETHEEDRVISSAADIQEDGHKQDAAKEITETHNGGNVMSPAETQEACINHVSAKEITERQDNVMCSAADGNKQQDSAKEITEIQDNVTCSSAGGNKQDATKEVSETHNERHVINLADNQEEGDCNKHVSALAINELHDEAHVMSSAADTQEDGHKEVSAMEITEAHAVGHGIHHDTWETVARDQTSRRTSLRKGVVTCQANRTARAVKKMLERKTTAGDPPPGTSSFLCPYCKRTFRARIGLTSHLRTHGSIL